MKKKNEPVKKEPEKKTIPAIDIRKMVVHLEGESELICNRLPPRVTQWILDKATGQAVEQQKVKDPNALYLESMYPHPDGGYGLPGAAFRKAIISACTSMDKTFPKTKARQAIFVVESMVKLEGEPHMRQDVVRIPSTGNPDLRFRSGFRKWKTKFTLRYNASVFSRDRVIQLLNTSGFAVGVGDWRPEKDGSSGQYSVRKIEEI